MKLWAVVMVFLTTIPALGEPSKAIGEFAGAKLGQSFQDSSKFFIGKNFHVIVPGAGVASKAGIEKIDMTNPDTYKALLAREAKTGKLCALIPDRLDSEGKIQLMTFSCGVVKGASSTDVIDTYNFRHLTEGKDVNAPSAFLLGFHFRLANQKDVGSGLVGKLGSVYTTQQDQVCDSDLAESLKLKDTEKNRCFMTVWRSRDQAAVAYGYGASLETAKIAKLDILNSKTFERVNQLQAKSQEKSHEKDAKKLGF